MEDILPKEGEVCLIRNTRYPYAAEGRFTYGTGQLSVWGFFTGKGLYVAEPQDVMWQSTGRFEESVDIGRFPNYSFPARIRA